MKIDMRYFLFFCLFFVFNKFNAQFLSNLNVTENDPLYATYAASLERSEYIVNQAYNFVFYDPNKSIAFESKHGGNISFAFKLDYKVKTKISEFYQKPIITASYSDIVKFYFYPFKNIRIDCEFFVYSSRLSIINFNLVNQGIADCEFSIYTYFYFSDKQFENLKCTNNANLLAFNHFEKPDNWMKEHNIPFQEDIKNILLFNSKINSYSVYENFSKGNDTSSILLFNDLKNKSLQKTKDDIANILGVQITFNLKPNERVAFKMVRGVYENEKNFNSFFEKAKILLNENLDKYLKENENIYSKIPDIKFNNKIYEAIYWNCFSLIRQCMLPPEGECNYNYYVFSREPRWGWGYGGQVFHESLVMLAYVFMDPIGAMNSQRVFMERQREDGYINYRTGPYLNETIETDGQFTSSAPWFNWQNYEIYLITKNYEFLKEAYNSGKKFYEYYTKNRDSDNDGLCEWGADAVLESVRDARVAVWDEVGDPKNFEAVDLNIMLVSEANTLSKMAETFGFDEEARKFKEDAEKRKKLINDIMWDEETDFYYHVNKNDNSFTFKKENDLKRKEIIAFLALWANVADKDKAEKLIQHLTNPKTFWRKFGIPSLSADDPYYNPIGYWNGPIWIQWQYLIFRGLLNYGYNDLAKELTDKLLDNIGYHLRTNHWFWEFYSADDYQAGWNKTYIWTGIAARFLIDLHLYFVEK
ncbi:MAG: hypothetical protein JXA68_01185 [Ignavibacteriales bacterium]|nr:hypothetical protein [Ignavibacteriales bacterium]